MSAIADPSNWLERAPVAPRGWVVSDAKDFAPDPQTLPLEVLVRRELSDKHGAVALWAGSGFGKTTALRHLAKSLQDMPDVTWLDEPDQRSVDAAARDRRIVFTAKWQYPCSPCTTLAIAPWRDDDVIEYLLARHRHRIGSVMSRVGRDEQRNELGGSPMLWTIVLDAMAADESIPDCATALCAHLDRLLDTDAALEAAGRAALLSLCRSDELIDESSPSLKSVAHLIQQPFVRTLLASEHITWNLARAVDSDDLALSLPLPLIEMVAKRVVRRPASIQRLQSIVIGTKATHQAMAASILLRAKPDWRDIGSSPCLQNASLRGAKWARLDLRGVDLCNADLSQADLHDAVLEVSAIAHARFDGADLRAANLRDVKAVATSFAGADLRKARLDRADLNDAVFDRANLSFTTLRRAILDGCSLRGALLIGANLEGARLPGANVDDADFLEADFSLAVLDNVELNKCRRCRGAVFRRASLQHADLSEMQLPGADFVKANLDHADLTATVIPDSDFHGATLTNAGLADIDWPNADLRRVDFTGASFHLGSSRSGLVVSTIPCEGSRTGFYTDELTEQDFKSPEEIRKANLCGANLRGANIEGTDWYLVDLRGATYSKSQRDHFMRCGAIL